MRVPVLIASPLLGAALVCAIPLTVQAQTVQTQPGTGKITCRCDCPENQKAKPRQTERMRPHHYAGGPYSYRDAMAVHWRVSGPAALGQGDPDGLVIDQAGWSGGVGYGADGGGGGGYGQLLLVNGAGQNGPTYNSFGESFQQNPSMAHPFQNRLMGGLARRR